MIVIYIMFGLGLMFDIYLMRRIGLIRQNGKVISGRIAGKEPYNDDDIERYLDVIEYTRSDGIKGQTKANLHGGSKRKGIGKEVQLYECIDNGKTKVCHMTTYLGKLYASISFTVLMLIVIILEAN